MSKAEVEAIAVALADIEIEEAQLKMRRTALEEKACVLGAGAEGEVVVGTTTLVGEIRSLKLTRKVNVSYPDKEGLEELILDEDMGDKGLELFRLNYSERASEVTAFLESGHCCAALLGEMRTTKMGKVSVKVVANK